MPLYQAFFDDSGSHAGAVVRVVCGFAAATDQWAHFSDNWMHILRMPQFDLDYLHLRELNTGKGKFAKFKGDRALQDDLLDRLQRLITVRARASFGATIMHDAFATVDAEFEMSETVVDPFTLAVGVSIRKLGNWMRDYHFNDDLQIIFDQGSAGWGKMAKRVKDEFGHEPDRLTSHDHPPLQAADLASWEHHRAVTQMAKANFGKVRFRSSYDALIARFPAAQWLFGHEDGLREMCMLSNIRRRSQ